MKPDILSRKRLKKIEEALHVERNKRELSRRYSATKGKGGDGEGFMEKWDDELEQLTVKLRNLREKAPAGEVGGLLSELAAKDDLIKRLENELKDREMGLEGLRGERSEMQSMMQDLKELVRRLEDGQKSLRAELKNEEKENMGLRKRLSKAEDVITVRDEEVLEKVNRIRGLSSLLDSREKELRGLGKKRVELKSESENITSKLRTESEKLRMRLEATEDEASGLRKRLEDSQSSLKEHVWASKNEVKSLEKMISGLEAAIEARDRSLEREIRRADKLKTSLDEKGLEVQEISSDKRLLEARSREVEKKFKEELNGLRRLLEEREEEAQKLRQKLEHWHAVIRDELDLAIEFITRQSEEISSLKATLEARENVPREREGLLYKRKYQ